MLLIAAFFPCCIHFVVGNWDLCTHKSALFNCFHCGDVGAHPIEFPYRLGLPVTSILVLCCGRWPSVSWRACTERFFSYGFCVVLKVFTWNLCRFGEGWGSVDWIVTAFVALSLGQHSKLLSFLTARVPAIAWVIQVSFRRRGWTVWVDEFGALAFYSLRSVCVCVVNWGDLNRFRYRIKPEYHSFIYIYIDWESLCLTKMHTLCQSHATHIRKTYTHVSHVMRLARFTLWGWSTVTSPARWSIHQTSKHAQHGIHANHSRTRTLSFTCSSFYSPKFESDVLCEWCFLLTMTLVDVDGVDG